METAESIGRADGEGPVIRASLVYLLMGKEYRISRNRRAEWFFSHLNATVTLKQKYKLEEYSEELEIVSIIPKDPPHTWSIETSHLFRYLVCSDTIVEILSRKYRFVYCLDVGPSAGSVDIQIGMVTLDAMFGVLQNNMEGLVKPFYVPGSHFIFQPKIYVTVIAHAPFLSAFVDEAIIQGVLLDTSTYKHVLQTIFRKLGQLENKVAKLSAIVNEGVEKVASGLSEIPILKGEGKSEETVPSTSLAMSPDFGLVDLLRHALIALHLLPENSASGLIVLTDGVISVPDGGYLDMVLSQLRYNTVSCSFIQLSSPFHPHACHGTLPYLDLMRFISNATFGAFLTTVPKIEADSQAMNVYHKSFLTWSFQNSVESFKYNLVAAAGNKPGEWSVQNKCFSTIRDMPIVKKQQYEATMNVDYIKVLSCRLREGFTIKEARVGEDSMLHIKLVLPWKFLILIEYILITPWPAPPSQPKITCVVSLEAPYDFLHDVTCLAKKPFQSYYRQLLVNRFWASQKHLSESDKLLAHFNSFSSNSSFYNIPERLKNGLPLFYISSNSAAPTFQSSELAFPNFSQFWKPVCLLDTEIWQKWMHTHRIGVILEHDHPIPKHIHQPNPSGRFHVIQCRQTMMALNTLLKDWSSFVLVENHSYIKLLFKEKDKPPYSFCIIRVATKPPCVMLRLAFLVGTSGNLRHHEISELRQRIAGLTFPPRLNEPPKWRVPSGNSILANHSRNYKRTWSDMPCCVILYKPIEKILIRYEQIPGDFGKTLLPQDPYNNFGTSSRKTTSNQSTFGFRPTYSTPWGSHVKMGPEMFNTVARYLHHRRWIWLVQITPTHPLSMECITRILATITKMRLQEGLRFAYSSAGIVNLIVELELQNERLGELETDIESIEDYERTTSVLQYVMFPPATTLVSSVDEDEEEREEEVETCDESSDLYLITECWIEPQVGKILSSTESASFNGLEYHQVLVKMFDMDQECISALLTFEHLSMMCQSDDVPSPVDIVAGSEKRLDPIEDKIQYIPFTCELKRILPKCQQAELLFSMFNQDLSMSFPVVVDSEISTFCDRANSILFESWIANIAQIHDREVILHPDEHRTFYELLAKRGRPLAQGEVPFAFAMKMNGDARSYPKWRSFIKGLSPTHFLLTVLPASYHDLKLLLLSHRTLDKMCENKAVFLLPTDDQNDSSYPQERSFLSSPTTPQPDVGSDHEEGEDNVGETIESTMCELPQTKVLDSTTMGSRKRSRVKSGGESGPLPKKVLSRKSSLDNLFRYRTNSVEAAWRTKTGKNAAFPKDLDDQSCIQSPKTESERLDSQISFNNRSRAHKLFPPNHQTKYGSITLPIYVYDCSLPTLTEHIIFRTCAGGEDIYTDCRVPVSSDDFSYPSKPPNIPKSPIKHFSPEPKSEEQDLPPTSGDTLENHCRALEVAFAKSYVHGLFESLQAGNYIHKNDVQEAIRLCRETKIEINLSDFIQTICRHFKEMRKRLKGEEDKEPTTSCDELKDIHAFIKRRFNQSILSAFHWVMDCAGIFYFKNTELKLGNALSRSNSSKNVSDAEAAKKDSRMVNGVTVATTDSLKSPELEPEYGPILGPDFFTSDESVEVPSEETGPVPLFLYLICTYIHGDVSGSFLVHDIPTCLEEIAEALGDGFDEGDPGEKVELFLEFVFLTVPAAVEEVDYRVAETIRTSSMCSISPIPLGRKGELNLIPFSKERENSLSGMFDHGGKAYPTLPVQQYHQVKSVVDEVKWLLKDEVTSFRWESSPLTELALTLVACHVEKSPGKPGCQVTIIPLNFVNSLPQIGYEKFKQRFGKSSIEGYELKEVGSLYYLLPIPNAQNAGNSAYGNAFWRTGKGRGLEDSEFSEEMKLSLEAPSTGGHVEFDLEDPEIVGTPSGRDQQRRLRKSSGQDSGRVRNVNAQSLESNGNEQAQLKRDPQDTSYLTTPSQLSEISSIVESMNTNEDGYEGDGSDSAEDFAIKLEISIRNRNLPPFWILCKLSAQEVVIYFHCRYDEDNPALFEYLIGLRNKIVRLVRQLKRVVNQDILLQQLHDTRQCSNLIESKTASPDYTEQGLHYPPPIVIKRIEDFDTEGVSDPKQFPSGYFACDVVWETKFVLHSRLRTGPGKSLVSRGIQTLQGSLIAFEVLNRQNMFVYRDSSGNVFYLRLYRMEDNSQDLSTQEIEDIEGASPKAEKNLVDDKEIITTPVNLENKPTSATPIPSERKNESVILLRVHGITEAGHEIKDNLVQSLRNKLDDAVMDILSVTLDRNPHCKLTPEDVTFMQKPNSPPDIVIQNSINSFACQHLPAFAFYLHQNLLQFLYLPKYTEVKPEFHFRDYPEAATEGESCGTIYFYNQRPGGTGSRGIASVAVSIVDSNRKPISRAQWSRPTADAFLAEFNIDDFEGRVTTSEGGKTGASPGQTFVELRIWKQGRLNIDLLKGFLSAAIKHSIWDLTTEFYFLTAPLCGGIGPVTENPQFAFSFSAPNTPKNSGNVPVERKLNAVRAPERTVESMSSLVGRRNSIVLPQAALQDKGLELEPLDMRLRSMSVNARKVSGNDGKYSQGRASSPMAFPFPGQALGKGRFQQLDPLVVGLNRMEAGEIGQLHSHYETLFPAWCDFGSKMNVPSLRVVAIDLATHHPVETVVVETEKLIQQIIPEYDSKQFWKFEYEPEEKYVAGGLRALSDSRVLLQKNMEAELKVLKYSLKRLEIMEKPLLDDYPSDMVPLFKESEEFRPTAKGDECILVSRNLIHWKFCVGSIDSQFFTAEAYKNQYKFSPLISAAWDQTPAGSYVSLEKLPRPTSATGLACLLNEPENNPNPILIPRQRLLLARVTKSKIFYVFYNWSKETTDRLMDSTKLLASWLNARSSLLSSIYAQKSGLFHNQAITRGPAPHKNHQGSNDNNPFTCGGAEVESLIRYPNPPKEFSATRPTNVKKLKSLKNLTPFLDSFRNIKHHATTFTLPTVTSDPFKLADDQIHQLRSSEKTEAKSPIFQYWLSRGPSASNIIGADGIQAFKQAARTFHYCLTPIIFLPRWRSELALTRDNSIGIVKKSRTFADSKQLGFQLKSDIAGRSRNDSGTSQDSGNVKGRSRSIWGLWHNSSSQISQESQPSSGSPSITNLSAKKGDEKWHSALCDSFIQEYMQYLQTLGFIPIQGRNSASKKLPQIGKAELVESERLRHISGASLLSSGSSQSGNSMGLTFNNFSRRVREDSGGDEKVFYLQRSLPGGIILFEVGLCEPFFYAKIHTLDVTRILGTRKSWNGFAYQQNILEFVNQCERMKVLMHLHSFTYDFHLRSIYSYILGRQLPLKQGYHITNFLDDFIKYYPKGPNFARNTVHIGMLTIQNVTTPATILFNYMLEKLYNMKVIRMNVERNYENNYGFQQYILVDMSSKKIVYRDMVDERQCDEFDLTLLIAHDSPPLLHPYSVDPSVLRLKYYIILTSRRELYPKLNDEVGDGKLCVVNTPAPLSLQQELKLCSGSGLSEARTLKSRKASLDDRTQPGSNSNFADSNSRGDPKLGFNPEIREESVHYMGYFTSHEQMMQQIISEQVDWVEERIRDSVSTASVDCRRDLLWQRLLLANTEKQKNKKEDLISRETVGALTYWEFGELLELVYVKSLSEMDPRLACLLRQPGSFYQSLLKLITQGSSHNFRYFASHDKSTHHMAIFGLNADIVSPKFTKNIVMLDINLDKRTSDLSILFKDIQGVQDPNKPLELEPEILKLIESVVNTVCYCWWWWSTFCPS